MWLVFVLACRAWVTFCGITFREFFCAGFVTVAGVIVAVLDSTLIKVGVLPSFFCCHYWVRWSFRCGVCCYDSSILVIWGFSVGRLLRFLWLLVLSQTVWLMRLVWWCLLW